MGGRVDLRHDGFHGVGPSSSVRVVAVERPHVRLSTPDAIHAVDRRGPADASDFRQNPPAESCHSKVLTLALLLLGDDAEPEDPTPAAAPFNGKREIACRNKKQISSRCFVTLDTSVNVGRLTSAQIFGCGN